MLRFYRTTEGIVTALVVYVAIAFGIVALHDAVSGSILLTLASIVFGGAGFYLYQDAISRIFDAVHDRSEGLLAEVFSA
jgi:small-conductance mechanosensitive channel